MRGKENSTEYPRTEKSTRVRRKLGMVPVVKLGHKPVEP